MLKAYIIIAHKNPEQLLRLIKILDDGCSVFFVHIDKRVSINHFTALKSLGSKVNLVKRVYSDWGAFGLVQCTLNAMIAIKESAMAFNRIILLSGQDYPIKSNDYINNYFQKTPYSIFFEYWPLPNYNKWPKNKGGMYRVNKYFFGFNFYQMFFSKLLNFISNFFPALKRKIPGKMKPFAGSQWWIIDMYALDYILNFVKKYPIYTSFHKHTFASDELFFQMILLNSKDEKLLSSIENDNKRFIKWKSASKSHPETIDRSDLNDIVNSPAFFARKFDLNYDSNILDLIDQTCLNQQISA
ncbi:beta-1,6-N-acetylglucosaminyltransferase [Mucilaginibacter arboris]|uniref:Peptide O-xylosyltransferase n=1 Tax=Mucilaginibacter arboris TaxID=2682090 RepID=A0A7K1T1L1_9SPHI|nr:beta-1,6-N-acetylglucosaminyltransferase [Mucilaginibacter arboris]MVN23444.1 hypothetical protein [Mucilaginibacter arboris]